jgi:hypothetical protein
LVEGQTASLHFVQEGGLAFEVAHFKVLRGQKLAQRDEGYQVRDDFVSRLIQFLFELSQI